MSKREYATAPWSDWLLVGRNGNNPGYEAIVRAETEAYAESLLDAVQLTEGMVLADIGAGDGLVAYRAIDRVGPSLKVVLTDISAPLLLRARAIASDRGIDRQCVFLDNPAETLSGIEDGAVDVVTSRSALAYVADKNQAFREFFRILKPGGRFSIAEPVAQDDANWVDALGQAVRSQPADSDNRFMSLLYRWKSSQYPPTKEQAQLNPFFNYSERDLVSLAYGAGFRDVHMQLHIDIVPSKVRSWQLFQDISPFPMAPSLRDILESSFSQEDRSYFESILRPTVEDAGAASTERMVFLQGTKPPVAK